MKDVENLVITKIQNAVRKEYPTALVSGEYVARPASFPYVYIVQTNKSVNTSRSTLDCLDFAYDVAFQVSVYSGLSNGAKQQCKDITELVNRTMAEMQFVMRSCMPLPNIDSRVYRMLSRYNGTVEVSIDGNQNILTIN